MLSINLANHIINDSFFKYISDNLHCSDISKLLLKNDVYDFDKKFAALQIECRNKTRIKLPEILKFEKFLFPKLICAEQCTPEMVAKFHASLFKTDDVVLDLTMGLGIDSYYISKNVTSVDAIEIDEEIAKVGAYNYSNLANKINVINTDSSDYIKKCTKQFSAIFVDPARRDANNKRMFGFSDCMPNILELMPYIKKCTKRLIIKASPMLDISNSINELMFVTDVWILGIKNSCKELLFELNFDQEVDKKHVMIHTLNFDEKMQRVDFQYDMLSEDVAFAEPKVGDLLFEPNSCIMKSGKTDLLPIIYPKLRKIDKSSHLFVADSHNTDLPGRKFAIMQVIPFKDKNIKQLKEYKQLNVSTRNFKLTAEQLKARLRVKDGGVKYLFGTTLHNGDMVLILCSKECD